MTKFAKNHCNLLYGAYIYLYREYTCTVGLQGRKESKHKYNILHSYNCGLRIKRGFCRIPNNHHQMMPQNLCCVS